MQTAQPLIHEDFLLHTPAARRLYHEYAEPMPVVDYHCHLDPGEIAGDRRFDNLTQAWLLGDHYKWRLMRAAGVPEEYITGDAPDYDKFLRWAETMPKAVGNPLYHWTHLELTRYFGIRELLCPQSAPGIWEETKRQLAAPNATARAFITRSGVKALCTTDDPADDLHFHQALAQEDFPTAVLPAFRPEKALHVEQAGFAAYIGRLSQAAGMPIESFDDLVAALDKRAGYFASMGCKAADQSLASPDFTVGSQQEARQAFLAAMNGETPTPAQVNAYHRQLMLRLGRIYHKYGFVMELHFGVLRNVNRRMFAQCGADTGFDVVGEGITAASFAALLDDLEATGELPRTIVFSLNENDLIKLATVAGSFQSGPAPAKIQLGAAWWFNDQKDGMLRQMQTLANVGLLSGFVGMLTDSRSFLSYTRHEYFRRLLCNLLGGWMEQGEAPMDFDLMGGMVQDICCRNAVAYFGLPAGI